jgi:orotate phosphoribosyltransferase
MVEIKELAIQRGNVPLRYARGHFATNHSHINYYIDITYQKTDLMEAKSIAKQLVEKFRYVQVDTVLCLDGMTVVGTCLANELVKPGVLTVNEGHRINIIEPEFNANSQLVFRDNIKPMIQGKHILVLMASMTTGYTVKRSIEAIGYYGGYVAGVAALYSAKKVTGGYPVASVYTLEDLPDYASYDYRECPYCKAGQKLDALVNSFGYSEL